MKFFFNLILLFFSAKILYAQEVDLNAENDFLKIFVGAGASFSNGYTINDYLSKNNIQTLTPVDLNITTGLSFYNKDVDIDLGYEMFASGKSNDNTKNRVISNGVKLRAYYVLPLFNDIEIGTGFTISYAKRKATLYYSDYILDFNNLENGINGNQITLFIEKAYAGPSFCVKFKETGRNNQQTKLTFSYEFPLNNKQWTTSFYRLENKIYEKNRNLFIANLTFCL